MSRTEPNPAYLAYAADEIADYFSMGAERYAMARVLRAIAWREGGLPTDRAELARRLGKSLKEFSKHADAILVAFREFDGRLTIPADELRRAEQKEKSRKAKASADARWQGDANALRTDSERSGGENANALRTDMPTQCHVVVGAVASPSSTSARVRARLVETDRIAFDQLLSKLPEPERWAAEMDAALDGMPGHHKVTPTQMGRAITDYLASGKVLNAKLIQFRRYLQVAGEEKPATAHSGLRAQAERLYELYTSRGFCRNLPMEDHDQTIGALLEEGQIKDRDRFRAELLLVKPWIWMGSAKTFDREKSITRIAQAIAALPQSAIAA
jgi:hypothetical protein